MPLLLLVAAVAGIFQSSSIELSHLPPVYQVESLNGQAEYAPHHRVELFCVCRFVNWRLQVWGLDGRIWNRNSSDAENLSTAEKAMRVYTEQATTAMRDSRMGRLPRWTPGDVYLVFFSRDHPIGVGGEAKGFYSPGGAGLTEPFYGSITELVHNPGESLSNHKTEDIVAEAVPVAETTPIFSFHSDLSDLPTGITGVVQVQYAEEVTNALNVKLKDLPVELLKRSLTIVSEDSYLGYQSPSHPEALPYQPRYEVFGVVSKGPDAKKRRLLTLFATPKAAITFKAVPLQPSN